MDLFPNLKVYSGSLGLSSDAVDAQYRFVSYMVRVTYQGDEVEVRKEGGWARHPNHRL